jgi:hypothetical protein
MCWQMSVHDVFSFADGRTVFVASTKQLHVAPTTCDLLVDGAVLGDLEVSEELSERRESSGSDDAAGSGVVRT